MNFTAENIYHIYNQGNNRQAIFGEEEDYLVFLRLINRIIKPHTEIIAWCLMPNHFHFLIYTDERSVIMIKQGGLVINSLTNAIRKLLSGYSRIFNDKYQKSGSLFRQKTKAKNILEVETIQRNTYSYRDYCRSAFWYIHHNPISARIVQDLQDWPWSSYLDYAGKRNGKLINKKLAEKYCDYNPIDFKNDSNVFIVKGVEEYFEKF